jgi:hypothetical protein
LQFDFPPILARGRCATNDYLSGAGGGGGRPPNPLPPPGTPVPENLLFM